MRQQQPETEEVDDQEEEGAQDQPVQADPADKAREENRHSAPDQGDQQQHVGQLFNAQTVEEKGVTGRLQHVERSHDQPIGQGERQDPGQLFPAHVDEAPQ